MGLEIVAPAGCKIVDCNNVVAVGEQQIDDSRADEPDPPVTNTFIPVYSYPFPTLIAAKLLRCAGDQRGFRRRGFDQHAPVMSGAVVKNLMPQLETQQPPDLARGSGRHSEIGEHLRRSEMGAAGHGGCESILHEVAQFVREPLLQRHRKAHLVAPVCDRRGSARAYASFRRCFIWPPSNFTSAGTVARNSING